MTTNEHPAVFRLDAVAAGDLDAGVDAHIATCASCRAYIEATRGAASAASTTTSKSEAASFVAKLEENRQRDAVREPSRVRFLRVAVPALAAAAALALFVRQRAVDAVDPSPGPTSASTAVVAPSSAAPPMRFKGRAQVAIVRDRGGEQERRTAEVSVKPGDRIRVEVGIDDGRPVVAGFLGNDGTWILLLAPSFLEAGTHLSEKSARFDEAPTEGTVLVGGPEDVERAKMTRSFEGVVSIPVTLER